jgi:hypothetical protein
VLNRHAALDAVPLESVSSSIHDPSRPRGDSGLEATLSQVSSLALTVLQAHDHWPSGRLLTVLSSQRSLANELAVGDTFSQDRLSKERSLGLNSAHTKR